MQITQIIPAHGWHAHFTDGSSTPIIAWGLQHQARVATIVPVSVNDDGSTYNPTKVDNFERLALKPQAGLKETPKTTKRVSSDESNGTSSARPSK